MMKQFFCAVAVALLCISCSSPKQKAEQDMFVSVKNRKVYNGTFVRGRTLRQTDGNRGVRLSARRI